MRKTKLFKRSAAVVISASMVLTSVNVIPELKEEAKAANATTPFASFDFTNSNLKEANGNGEVTGIENGEATADGLKLTNGHVSFPKSPPKLPSSHAPSPPYKFFPVPIFPL